MTYPLVLSSSSCSALSIIFHTHAYVANAFQILQSIIIAYVDTYIRTKQHDQRRVSTGPRHTTLPLFLYLVARAPLWGSVTDTYISSLYTTINSALIHVIHHTLPPSRHGSRHHRKLTFTRNTFSENPIFPRIDTTIYRSHLIHANLRNIRVSLLILESTILNLHLIATRLSVFVERKQ